MSFLRDALTQVALFPGGGKGPRSKSQAFSKVRKQQSGHVSRLGSEDRDRDWTGSSTGAGLRCMEVRVLGTTHASRSPEVTRGRLAGWDTPPGGLTGWHQGGLSW